MAKQSRHGPIHSAIPVLLTRPEAQSLRFAVALTARFGPMVQPIIAPLMRPVFHQPSLPTQDFGSVVFTSDTAVEAACRMIDAGQMLPARALCVGQQTAKAASAAGFDAVSADGDAQALVAMIVGRKPTEPLLYLQGRDTRGNLAERLISAGLETYSAIVYQQDPQPISAEALTVLNSDRPVIIPLFSPRSADLLAKALPPDASAPVLLAAMSEAVADHARPISHLYLHVVARPDADAMMEGMERLLILARSS